MNEPETMSVENTVRKEPNLLGKYLLCAAALVTVGALISHAVVRKQSSPTLEKIVRKAQASQPVNCNIYKNNSGNYDCVEIITASGSHYYPVTQTKAKTQLGLVDDSLKEGKEGYNHKMLSELVEFLNGGNNVVREDRTYYGLGHEIPKPNYLK